MVQIFPAALTLVFIVVSAASKIKSVNFIWQAHLMDRAVHLTYPVTIGPKPAPTSW